MVMRSRRLEDLLGGRLDALDYRDIANLVGNPDAAESEDLDYKQTLYAADDKGREELAKDVAALANHLGGVLILGMAENKGLPTKVFDVDLDDRHLRHIRQVIANNTSPPVPYQPIAVHSPDAPGTGFLLLAVPRSPQAPHAVTAPPTKATKDALRYPRRGGTQTDWLTETMVATAYRARYTAAASRDRRLTDVEEDIVDALVDRASPHLIVTLVPETPGSMPINSETFARYGAELRDTILYLGQEPLNLHRVTVGARRLIWQEHQGATAARAELHRDGSAALALSLRVHRSRVGGSAEINLQFAEPGDVVYQLLCALPFLAGHARDRAGASGTALVKAALVDEIATHPAASMGSIVAMTGRDEALPLRIDFIDSASGQRVRTSTQSCSYAASEVTVLLDEVADHSRGLLQATALLADELVQAFGLPETQLINSGGHIQPDRFTSASRAAVTRWAQHNDLLDPPIGGPSTG